MLEHEDKYFHIPKIIVKAFLSMIFSFGMFWWGIVIFEPFMEEYRYIFLVPYSVTLIIAFIFFIGLTWEED